MPSWALTSTPDKMGRVDAEATPFITTPMACVSELWLTVNFIF